MSQFWHAHWAEDAFKPSRLGNWQVPNWHPKVPCAGHCTTTTFLADTSGRLLPDQPRSKRSPWGDFKGTWELPLKIDRKLARILSAPPRYKLAAWEAHKLRHQTCRGTTSASPRKIGRKAPVKQVHHQNPTIAEKPGAKVKKPVAKANRVAERKVKPPKKGEMKNIAPKERMKNLDRDEHVEDGQIGGQEQRLDTLDREERNDHEREIVEEQEEKKLGREKDISKGTTRCFCRDAYTTDSLSSRQVTPKAARTNICTVHRRLRV